MKIAKYFSILFIIMILALGSCQHTIEPVNNKSSQDTVVKHEKYVVLVYRNIKTGELLEYTPENLPWQDTVLLPNLEFVDQITKER